MKRAFFTLLLLFSLNSCFAQWSYWGLGHTKVSNLNLRQDTLYASTWDGIYKRSVLTTDTLWTPMGKQGEHVIQTVVVSPSNLIAVVEIGNTSHSQLMQSLDGGQSFSLLHPDTSGLLRYDFMDHVAVSGANKDSLYFLNHGIRTFDGGNTWTSLNASKNLDCFIKLNPQNSHQVIIGGETGFHNAYFQLSEDRGDSWSAFYPFDFFAGDNAIHDLALDGNRWFAAGEGVLNLSVDSGQTWIELLNLWNDTSRHNLYYTDIALSPVNSQYLYSTGFKSSGQEDFVPLLFSPDAGANWQFLGTQSFQAEQQILAMEILNDGIKDRVFLGGKGVYVYENSSVARSLPRTEDRVSIYPNPVQEAIQLQSAESFNSYRIYNALGQIQAQGTVNGVISCRGIPSGIYFLELQGAGQRPLRIKFLKKKN